MEGPQIPVVYREANQSSDHENITSMRPSLVAYGDTRVAYLEDKISRYEDYMKWYKPAGASVREKNRAATVALNLDILSNLRDHTDEIPEITVDNKSYTSSMQELLLRNLIVSDLANITQTIRKTAVLQTNTHVDEGTGITYTTNDVNYTSPRDRREKEEAALQADKRVESMRNLIKELDKKLYPKEPTARAIMQNVDTTATRDVSQEPVNEAELEKRRKLHTAIIGLSHQTADTIAIQSKLKTASQGKDPQNALLQSLTTDRGTNIDLTTEGITVTMSKSSLHINEVPMLERGNQTREFDLVYQARDTDPVRLQLVIDPNGQVSFRFPDSTFSLQQQLRYVDAFNEMIRQTNVRLQLEQEKKNANSQTNTSDQEIHQQSENFPNEKGVAEYGPYFNQIINYINQTRNTRIGGIEDALQQIAPEKFKRYYRENGSLDISFLSPAIDRATIGSELRGIPSSTEVIEMSNNQKRSLFLIQTRHDQTGMELHMHRILQEGTSPQKSEAYNGKFKSTQELQIAILTDAQLRNILCNLFMIQDIASGNVNSEERETWASNLATACIERFFTTQQGTSIPGLQRLNLTGAQEGRPPRSANNPASNNSYSFFGSRGSRW